MVNNSTKNNKPNIYLSPQKNENKKTTTKVLCNIVRLLKYLTEIIPERVVGIQLDNYVFINIGDSIIKRMVGSQNLIFVPQSKGPIFFLCFVIRKFENVNYQSSNRKYIVFIDANEIFSLKKYIVILQI
jgi:hypothetical protein